MQESLFIKILIKHLVSKNIKAAIWNLYCMRDSFLHFISFPLKYHYDYLDFVLDSQFLAKFLVVFHCSFEKQTQNYIFLITLEYFYSVDNRSWFSESFFIFWQDQMDAIVTCTRQFEGSIFGFKLKAY